MVNRHWLGDVSLAILLALPFAALVQPRANFTDRETMHAAGQLSVASSVPSNGRISLLG